MQEVNFVKVRLQVQRFSAFLYCIYLVLHTQRLTVTLSLYNTHRLPLALTHHTYTHTNRTTHTQPHTKILNLFVKINYFSNCFGTLKTFIEQKS
jgi:hypothetical protein